MHALSFFSQMQAVWLLVVTKRIRCGVLPLEVWGHAANFLQVGLNENTESTTAILELTADTA